MKKIIFLTKIVVLTVLVLAFVCTMFSTVTNAGEKLIKWKMSTYWPPIYQLIEGDKCWHKFVHQVAGDQIQIKWYPAGSIVPGKQLFDAVAKGTLEVAGEYPGYWAGKDTAFNLLASYPLGFNFNDYMNWIWQGGGFDLFQEAYGKFGIFYLPHTVIPMESGIRSNKPINSIADFKGLKIRISGKAQGHLLRHMGAAQVSISSSEVYQAMQKGVLDAAESCNPNMDWDLGYGEITKYWCSPGFHQPSSVLGVMVNKKAWNGLSEDLKAKILVATQATNTWAFTFYDYTSIEATQKFLDKGIKITRLSNEDLRILNKAINKYTLEEAKKNPFFAKVAYSMFKYQKDSYKWHKIASPYHYAKDPALIPDLDALKACIK